MQTYAVLAPESRRFALEDSALISTLKLSALASQTMSEKEASTGEWPCVSLLCGWQESHYKSGHGYQREVTFWQLNYRKLN